MKPVFTVLQMRAADAVASETTPVETLIDRAGYAVAHHAVVLMGGAYGRRVLVVAGKGNNGSDGRSAAAYLRRRGARVVVIAPGAPLPEGAAAEDGVAAAEGVVAEGVAAEDGVAPESYSPETDDAGRLQSEPASVADPALPSEGRFETRFDLVIDSAFGTGFSGRYDPPRLLPGVPVLAVDIPSGVDGDNGEGCGSPWPADATVTFAALKPGLLQGAGAELSGRVHVIDIGLDVGSPTSYLVEDADVYKQVPPRSRSAHKWTSAVAVIAGSPGKYGAAQLSVLGAQRLGAGMLWLGVPGADLAHVPAGDAVSFHLPRSGWADQMLDLVSRFKAIVVGPGLGRASQTGREVRRLVAHVEVPVVVDADGLIALGDIRQAAAAIGVSRSSRPVVLTPHLAELAHLTGSSEGNDNPFLAARKLAADVGAIVLLKGPTTVVAGPTGEVRFVTSGDARLATAGTGDVLSGAIAALLARGTDPLEAAAVAAHVHGRAASSSGASGMVASDLPGLMALWMSRQQPMSQRQSGT